MIPHAAELFAGGGALAVGLCRGGLRPVAAVEIDDSAARTFRANHPNVVLFHGDVRRLTGRALLEASPSGAIDVLAACPPCQGFSTLTSKYDKADPRNELVAEVGRIARETLPLAIMMENVPGLAQRGLPKLDALVTELESLGYAVRHDVLQVADFGVPQRRRRLVLLAGLGFAIDMPRPTHARVAVCDRAPWRTLRDAIGDFPRAPIRLDEALASGGPEAADWHLVRQLRSANLARLAAAEPGNSRRHLAAELRPACHRGEGEGFRNVYGRMEWDKPSSTITAGCLSPSKGRFGHPDELRTISLREAAALQTFPPDYRFVAKGLEDACSIVGNALPCLFAQRITEQVVHTLRRVTPWLPPEVAERRRALLN